MRLVGIKTLAPGDKLAASVCSSGGKVILNSGVVLNENYIDRLKQIGIYKVYIDDGRFDDVEFIENLDQKTKNTAIQVLKDTYERVHKGKEVDEYLLKDSAKSIVEFVRGVRDKGISILANGVIDEYIIDHSINVAILTAFIANRLNYNYSQLCDLVTGSLIHDMGRENKGEENPEHVQKGFDVMRRCRGLSLHSSIVCYEHHENYDGTGFPRRLKGTAISEFSRIIRVADFYDTALHGYENNNIAMMPHQAYENVLAVSGQILDPEMVAIFRDSIIFYPNGCTVKLSNGLKGVVVRQNLGSPQRPVIRIYNENTVIGEIDLLKSLTFSVMEVLIV